MLLVSVLLILNFFQLNFCGSPSHRRLLQPNFCGVLTPGLPLIGAYGLDLSVTWLLILLCQYVLSYAFSALTLFVWRQEGHLACKN